MYFSPCKSSQYWWMCTTYNMYVPKCWNKAYHTKHELFLKFFHDEILLTCTRYVPKLISVSRKVLRSSSSFLRVHRQERNVAQKKLVSFGIFRMIPYLHHLTYTKIWVYPPWTDLNSKSRFFGKGKNWRFSNFKNNTHVKQFYNFQLFVNFSTDSKSPAIKFFRTSFRNADILV